MIFLKKRNVVRRPTLRTGLRSRTLRTLDRKNERNKLELPIAHILGASLTKGSGAVNDDGDMRIPGYLVEHKQRNKDVVSVPYKTWEKIQRQAQSRGLNPLLIMTSGTVGESVVIKEVKQDNNTLRRAYKQVRVNVRQFIDFWSSSKVDNKEVIPTSNLYVSRKGRDVAVLSVTHIQDFKKQLIKE